MNILGIDWGERKLGVAISRDQSWVFPLRAISVQGFAQAVEQIHSIVKEQHVSYIVLGLPLGLDGRDTQQTSRIREVASDLGNVLGVPVDLVDERLTSRAAQKLQHEANKLSSNDDTGAAVAILQTYLAQRK